jgi:Metallo-peptidase family M12B Reprolysin-like
MSIRPLWVASGLLVLNWNSAQAQVNLSNLWREVPTTRVSPTLNGFVTASPVDPSANGPLTGYREFDLNPKMLVDILSGVSSKPGPDRGMVPFGRSISAGGSPDKIGPRVSIPDPNGKIRLFAVEDSHTLSPGLAERHPEVRTFRGIALDDLRVTLRLQLTPSGLHALVRDRDSSFRVEPVQFDPAFLFKQTRYASFLTSRIEPTKSSIKCITPPPKRPIQAARPAPVSELSWGGTYRTYRLAVATTGYYAKAVGGTSKAAFDAIAQTVDNVNEIYERELSIHMELIPAEDKLISTDPATDKLDNDDAGVLIKQSQARIDSIVGDAAYDIGHTFSTNTAGLAALGSVRQSGYKAQGVTGIEKPTGPYFDIDYVSHEMGHQFGANHTFNGNTGACSGNRNETTAYEPGSGTTILGYAGICKADDLQLHSDPYFHSISLTEIARYVSGAGETNQKLATGSPPPKLTATLPRNLPVRTPFHLNASVVGATAGDPWTFSWEEFDLGPSVTLSAPDDGHIPLFKSQIPDSHSVRVFGVPGSPAGGPRTELLPQTARSSEYRVTVRGIPAKGGVFSTADINLHFIATAGPFEIVSPNVDSVPAGTIPIKWNVAHTNESPIDVDAVRILMSTDGGKTFPIPLIATTPNNGSASVTLPKQAGPIIVRVESINNYFFADSKPISIK